MSAKPTKLELKLAEELASGFYLRTGRLLKSEVFLGELQRKFNPNHDPDDGRFTFGQGGAGGGGNLAARLTERSGSRVNPGRTAPERTIPSDGAGLAKLTTDAAREAAKVMTQARTVALSYHPPVRALLHQIARGEGVDDESARLHGFASSYDVPFNYGRFARQSKPLTQMTLGELDELQTRFLPIPETG